MKDCTRKVALNKKTAWDGPVYCDAGVSGCYVWPPAPVDTTQT